MSSSAPKKILILDDELTTIITLSCTLRPDGATIVTAARLASADAAAKCQPFDLVITDINLSAIIAEKGLRLLSDIKQSRPEINVVVISSRPSAKVEQIALDLGVDYRYERPTDIPQIIMSFMMGRHCRDDDAASAVQGADGMGRVPRLNARDSIDCR